ncbi:hypothetical protein QR680_015473 [Steinernema hermaphroditum]|uniref:Glycosyltransferase family 92 protein n=1 Tax=Steinernema hermaphroditum TaxID=289476 RepID=A0AA39LKM9_9BILA|nr:hypothetical protein QR680_015473 [Steinernema hermaphroditum]
MYVYIFIAINSTDLADLKDVLRQAIGNLTKFINLVEENRALEFNSSQSIAQPAHYLGACILPKNDSELLTLFAIMLSQLNDLRDELHLKAQEVRYFRGRWDYFHSKMAHSRNRDAAQDFVNVRGDGWDYLNHLILLYKNWAKPNIVEYYRRAFVDRSETVRLFSTTVWSIKNTMNDENIEDYMQGTRYSSSALRAFQSDIISWALIVQIAHQTRFLLRSDCSDHPKLWVEPYEELYDIQRELLKYPGRYYNDVIDKGLVPVIKDLIDKELSTSPFTQAAKIRSPKQLANIYKKLAPIVKNNYNFSDEYFGVVLSLRRCQFSISTSTTSTMRTYKGVNVIFYHTFWSRNETQENYKYIQENDELLHSLLKCRKRPESWALLLGKQRYPISLEYLQNTCPDRMGCIWVDYRLTAELPFDVDLNQPTALIHDDTETEIEITASQPEKRTKGLDICVAPIYYYNFWIRIVEFVELYRQQGASHIYIYVSSASKLVDDMLKVYEKEGLVTVVRWPQLPELDGTTESVFRLGQYAAMLDCLMRSKGRYVATVDLDDYIFTKDGNLVDYLEDEERKNPNIGSFKFHVVHVAQEPREGNISDWRMVDFSGLLQGDMCDKCYGNFKAIHIANRPVYVGPHNAARYYRRPGFLGALGVQYDEFVVPKSVGMSHHPRYAVVRDQLDFKGVQPFLSNEIVNGISKKFTSVMEEFSKSHPDLTTPPVAKKMMECNPFNPNVCQVPYVTCRNEMKNVDHWIFANESSHLLVL